MDLKLCLKPNEAVKIILRGRRLKIQGFFQVLFIKASVFKGIPGLERKIPKFKEFQVFELPFEPYMYLLANGRTKHGSFRTARVSMVKVS